MTTSQPKRRPEPFLKRDTNPEGESGLAFSLHKGQRKAMRSKKRIVAVIAGGRSGKTCLGPAWLWGEMRRKGPGDYLVAAPSNPILDRGAAPAIEELFSTLLGFGTFTRAPFQFRFSEAGCAALGWGRPDRQPRILFSHATDPNSLEAFDAKAAWLDEAGQQGFRLASWEAVLQRLSLDRGRVLITTKPYTRNWLKTKVYDPWQAAKRAKEDHPSIDVVNYGSAMNPAMPPEEVEDARATLPAWKFRMHWLGEFDRPAGRIYECWDEAAHVHDPFRIPSDWHRWGGLDFGAVNTAAVVLARRPCGRGPYYLVREYHQGGLTAKGHASALRRLAGAGHKPDQGEREPGVRCWVGGSKSEGQWRREFGQAGMPVAEPPISDVEVGIQRVHALLSTGRLVVFRSCEHVVEELESYSRVVDEAGEPTEAIEDKASYHLADALRYVCARLEGDARRAPTFAPRVIERKGR